MGLLKYELKNNVKLSDDAMEDIRLILYDNNTVSLYNVVESIRGKGNDVEFDRNIIKRILEEIKMSQRNPYQNYLNEIF